MHIFAQPREPVSLQCLKLNEESLGLKMSYGYGVGDPFYLKLSRGGL